MKTAYKAPTKGHQTTQTYHPERGEDYAFQVSTYNGNSWFINFCSQADLKKTQESELKRVI